ncbi:hypothetical protein F5882DRAFT_375188 [Hyaloscypha sp. PMI_1271]|nr:hypothetical protein F5882DRAFT_375188 [Hyaloscypha sp. PMI_1271]
MPYRPRAFSLLLWVCQLSAIENACSHFLLIASSYNFDVCYDSSAKLLSNHIHKVHVGVDPTGDEALARREEKDIQIYTFPANSQRARKIYFKGYYLSIYNK